MTNNTPTPGPQHSLGTKFMLEEIAKDTGNISAEILEKVKENRSMNPLDSVGTAIIAKRYKGMLSDILQEVLQEEDPEIHQYLISLQKNYTSEQIIWRYHEILHNVMKRAQYILSALRNLPK